MLGGDEKKRSKQSLQNSCLHPDGCAARTEDDLTERASKHIGQTLSVSFKLMSFDDMMVTNIYLLQSI